MVKADLNAAVKAKIERLSRHPRIPKILSMAELERGEWYIGESWCCHVAMWDGETFKTIRLDREQVYQVMYYVAHVDRTRGFAPFKRIPNPRA